jgi:hypothetical protein
MTGVAQRDRREPCGFAFFDADPNGLRCHGLPVPEFAVDHRQRRRIDDEFGVLIGNDGAHLLPPYINGHPDHAVAVVACEIRGREIRRDAPGFVGRGIGVGENVRNEVDQSLNLDGDHSQSLALSFCLIFAERASQALTLPWPPR